MKVFKWVVGLVAVLVVSIFVGIYIYLNSTLPEYNGEIAVTGISGEVEIIRDSFGMPHIYAATDKDAAFALGYCTAQDRLFQMELIRRSIRGRLSEVLGEDFVDIDRLFRTITAKKSLDEMFADLSPEVVAIMEAYAAGINHYLSHYEGKLPFEFALLGYQPEYWTAADEMASLYYMAWSLNFSFNAELTHSAIIEKVGREMASELFVGYPSDGPTILPPEAFGPEKTKLLGVIQRARELTGTTVRACSNNWVVSGDKSETGSPLLANDMHLGLIIPGVWYEAHLVTPDQNVSGVVLPGVPVIVAGANQHIAWGFTNVMADDADYYMEKLNPEDSNQYEFEGQWEDIIVRHDTIEVLRGEPVPIEIRMTRHGIIIDDILESEKRSDHPIAMRWTLTDFNREAEALYLVNRARDINEVERAAALHKCPGQNWVYADDQGNIGFWAAVGIPIRDGYDAGQLLPGWDGNHEWAGYVATEDQPHLRNPSTGWIATANNRHVGDGYPHAISSYYAPPDRIERISRMLGEKEKLGIDDFKKMHADQYLVMAENWVPRMISALAPQSLTEIQNRALTILKDWDYYAKPDQAAPAIFHVAVQTMTENIFTERLGDSLCNYWLANSFIVHNALNGLLERGRSEWFDNPKTDAVETLDSVLVDGFTAAVEKLAENYGDNPDEWSWGRLHTLTLFNPVGSQIPILGKMTNIGPYPMGGGSHSVNPGLYRLTEPFAVLAGASQRHIFDLGNMKNSLRVIPSGISGNFMSDHYDDQVELWRQVEYRPFFLDRDDVEKEATYRMKMVPVDNLDG
jgi:penicillin amidase